MEQTQGVYTHIEGIEVVSGKTLKQCICCLWVLCQECVYCVMQIRLLADPYCVGDGNTLPEPWGAAQQAVPCVCAYVHFPVCVCASISRKGLCRSQCACLKSQVINPF